MKSIFQQSSRVAVAAAVLCGACALLSSVPAPVAVQSDPKTPAPAAGPSGPASRQDGWRIIGPGGGGAQYFPSISPHDPKLVFVACDMSGNYVSEDGGNSWREFNLLGKVRQFAFDPQDPKVVYARGAYIWRSDDRGKTWGLAYPDPSTMRGTVYFDGDEPGRALLVSGGPGSSITAFAADPQDSNQLYLNEGQDLYYSKDRGRTFRVLGRLPSAPRFIYPDPRSPAASRRVYIVGPSWTALWDSRQMIDQGKIPGPEWVYDSVITFPGSGAPWIYTITDFQYQGDTLTGGLLLSKDGGQTWFPRYESLLAMRDRRSTRLPGFTAIAASAADPNVLYLSYTGLEIDGHNWFGVAKSEDRGVTWKLLWKESDRAGENIHDAWTTKAYGPDWAENPISLGVSPKDPNLVYGTDYARTMRSTDGGKTWNAVYSYKTEDGGYATTGIDVTSSYGVHFDPFDSRRMFITYTDIGLFRSENGGQSWFNSNGGVPRTWRNSAYWVAFDPRVRGRMWAAFSRVHDLPHAKMFHNSPPKTFKGGVVVSDDGGKTWRPSNRGMPEAAVTDILVDPASPPDAPVLYATAIGWGVFQSKDGGANWTLKRQGIAGENPLAWHITAGGAGTLYLIVVRQDEGPPGPDNDGALYRSTNGAESWERVPLPAGLNGPTALAVDPGNPKRLYLAAFGRYKPGQIDSAHDGGIWLSDDGGGRWRNVYAGKQYVYDVTPNPQDPSMIFATTYQNAILRSTNRGESWERIRGFNFWAANRIFPDPLNPKMLYVTTYGSSVWYGPASGAPEAIEDIVSPPLARFNSK